MTNLSYFSNHTHRTGYTYILSKWLCLVWWYTEQSNVYHLSACTTHNGIHDLV